MPLPGHPKPDNGAVAERPILFVDVDGVISLFGWSGPLHEAPGRLLNVEGIMHCIGDTAGALLGRLAPRFELVWATGWEDKANDHLPKLLGLEARRLPVVSFDGRAVFGTAHWKIDAIDRYAADRPAAWIDDNLDERCERWARERTAPTLLVRTEPATGIEEHHVERLLAFADEVEQEAA